MTIMKNNLVKTEFATITAALMNGLQKRWKDKKHIFEWDYQHGTVEKYNKRGIHQGEFDPETGRQLKPPDPSRNIKKYL